MKIKTNATKLKEEAKKVMLEAKKKSKQLLQEAKELEYKTTCELGEKCISFLNGEIEKEELLTFAKNNNLIFIDKKTDDTSENTNESV